MKLQHEGYLFFQPKRNLAFHFPFLTVTENSALCIQVQVTELRITSFIANDSASAHSLLPLIFIPSGAVVWLFLVCVLLFVFLPYGCCKFLQNNFSLLHFYCQEAQSQNSAPFVSLMLCISRSNFTSGSSYFAYLVFYLYHVNFSISCQYCLPRIWLLRAQALKIKYEFASKSFNLTRGVALVQSLDFSEICIFTHKIKITVIQTYQHFCEN